MDRFAAALVNLANALEEWKNAGADVLLVVGAIQEFIDAKSEERTMDKCAECGMPVANPAEYHPYAACLMFKACHNSKTVVGNLTGVIEYGMVAERKGLDSDQAFHDTRLTRARLGASR